MKKYAILLLSLLILTTCESDDPIQFKLSTQVNPPEGGTISPSSGTFNEGKEITFKATPSDEYIFKNWSGDASGDENPMVAVMTDDMFLTANFEKKTYELSIEIIGKGTVKQEVVQAKSSTDYASGTQVQLTAFPDEGWEFVRWDAIQEMWYEEENPMVLDMFYHHKVTAIFEPLNKEKIHIPDDNFELALIELGLDYYDGIDNYVYAEYIKDVEELRLEGKGIKDLTGIEGFAMLNTLVLTNNNLTNLDLSQNILLRTVDVRGNPLSCINISPIQLYDGGFGPKGEWLVTDEGVFASVDCSVTEEDIVYVPGDAFEQALIDLGLDDVLDDYVQSIRVINVFDLDLSGRNISDLTGIEGFQGLLILDVSNNELASLDISGINFYYQIDVRDNPLTCVQVNEWQLNSLGGGVSFIWRDDEVEFSLDCGY